MIVTIISCDRQYHLNIWYQYITFCFPRLYRPWRTTTRKSYLSTGTLDSLAWSLRILSLHSVTCPPTSRHMRLNWAGTGRTWQHTSTCCLRLQGSSGSRHNTCHALLLCWVRSSSKSLCWCPCSLRKQLIWKSFSPAGNHILPDEDLAAFHWSLLGPEHPLASLKVHHDFKCEVLLQTIA